jgi:hypothetical protein
MRRDDLDAEPHSGRMSRQTFAYWQYRCPGLAISDQTKYLPDSVESTTIGPMRYVSISREFVGSGHIEPPPKFSAVLLDDKLPEFDDDDGLEMRPAPSKPIEIRDPPPKRPQITVILPYQRLSSGPDRCALIECMGPLYLHFVDHFPTYAA